MNTIKKNDSSGLLATIAGVDKDTHCTIQGRNTPTLENVLRTLKEAGFGDTTMKISVVVIELNPK